MNVSHDQLGRGGRHELGGRKERGEGDFKRNNTRFGVNQPSSGLGVSHQMWPGTH
jgi:hypothetical protein